MLLTVPLGHNGALDAEVLTLGVAGAETYAMDRRWRWCRRSISSDFTYHDALRSAQSISVGNPSD